MQSFWQDMKYAIRSLRNAPGFALIAIVTLGLGMAVNTTVFSVINGLLLRSLPVPHPEQITVLALKQQGTDGFQAFSYPDYQDIRSESASTAEVFAYRTTLVSVVADNRGDHCVMSRVTGNYFSALGVRPALGRLILPSEGQTPNSDPVIVLSYAYWQKRFNRDPNILGKTLQVDDRPMTVIGVSPKGFLGTYAFLSMDGFMPIGATVGTNGESALKEFWSKRDQRSISLMARLSPGVDVSKANAAFGVLANRIAEQHPDSDKGISIRVFPEKLARPEPDPDNTIPNVSLAFTALGALVLLVACFNIANVLLVRATVRQREMAIRAAVGAGRARLIRQYLTESLMLSILGGSAGMMLGWWAAGFLGSLNLGTDLPVQFNFEPDLRVFLFTLSVVLFTGAIVGILPALRVARTDVNSMLREGGRGTTDGGRRHWVRNGLVMAQVAGSLLLLVVAGLFVRSARKAEHIALGFNPDHVLDLPVDVKQVGYTDAQGKEFFRSLDERLRVLPGVVSVSEAFVTPLSLISADEGLLFDGHEPEPGQSPPNLMYNMVSRDYFTTMQIPLRKGRVFTSADIEKAPRVAVVNDAMAQKFWPGQDVIGKRFRFAGGERLQWEVVGVVGDTKVKSITEQPTPFFYVPIEQSYMPLRTVHLRTSVPPDSVKRQAIAEIQELAPTLPIAGARTLSEDLGGINGYLFYDLGAQLTATMGLLGLLLAIVGVYSVVSYAAVQRTHEIGIRVALGASRIDILRMVLGQSILIVGVGIVVGLGISLAATRLVAGLLVGISPTDPATFISVVLLLAIVAVVACWLPAHRATRVNPLVALRYE
ncbi:MAG TPA: ABC transporter permease [Candidatus Acidoferrum sp.]|jgi:predicted permease